MLLCAMMLWQLGISLLVIVAITSATAVVAHLSAHG